jgi:hypothetical protein
MQGGNWLRYGQLHLVWYDVPAQAFGVVGGRCKPWPADCSSAFAIDCSGSHSAPAATAATVTRTSRPILCIPVCTSLSFIAIITAHVG